MESREGEGFSLEQNLSVSRVLENVYLFSPPFFLMFYHLLHNCHQTVFYFGKKGGLGSGLTADTFIKGLLETLEFYSKPVVIVFGDVYISPYLHMEPHM